MDFVLGELILCVCVNAVVVVPLHFGGTAVYSCVH